MVDVDGCRSKQRKEEVDTVRLATTTGVDKRATNVEISQSTEEMRVPGDRRAMSKDESAGTRVMSSAK